ncbi:MAG TPA: Hsp70 family protein, partial [Acetomicrobium sp.]|nr:Hsp70 family protein [Acetomicrobium sp.]
MESIPVGIDVGTRHSILAIIDDHIGPRVIKNRWGNEKTSSFVGYRHGRLCAAEDALPAVFTYPGGSCVSVKRHIGASQKLRLGGRTFVAEELLQVLLLYLREDAEAYLQAVVRECFIAVPSCFDFKQRDMVKSAAQKAGFRGVKLINEPTAAAMAVSLEGNVLVFDFGAGAVDISAVEKKSDLCHVLESIGSTKFGGMDLDKEIALHIWKLMGERGDPSEDPRWPLLLMEAEAIKESLSFTNVVNWWPRACGFILHRNKPLAIYREEIESLIAAFILPVLDLAKRIWDRYN